MKKIIALILCLNFLTCSLGWGEEIPEEFDKTSSIARITYNPESKGTRTITLEGTFWTGQDTIEILERQKNEKYKIIAIYKVNGIWSRQIKDLK